MVVSDSADIEAFGYMVIQFCMRGLGTDKQGDVIVNTFLDFSDPGSIGACGDCAQHFSNLCDVCNVVKMVHRNWSVIVTGQMHCHL